MFTKVYLGGQLLRLDPSHPVGQGGEAEVYKIDPSQVVKILKAPDHSDYQGSDEEHVRNREGAKMRLIEYQKKLPAFPRGLPSNVISPRELIWDEKKSLIVGYSMTYLDNALLLRRYADSEFRSKGVGNNDLMPIFESFHQAIQGLHQANVTIGDNNYYNVLVKNKQAFLIDADSFQYGSWLCRSFSPRVVDPTLCDLVSASGKSYLVLAKPYSQNSDWYSYAAILFECLLFIDPYGGAYKPKKSGKWVAHDIRPYHRITLFNPDVICPKQATHYSLLSDDLLEFFHKTFEKDVRGEFPIRLLENFRWTKCSQCGTEHGRDKCPHCQKVAPSVPKKTTVVRGSVLATKIFGVGGGQIVFATAQNGTLLWLAYENGQFFREDHNLVASGQLDPLMRFRISGNKTLLGKGSRAVIFQNNKPVETLGVDSLNELPIFDGNANGYFWVDQGELKRTGQFGPESIGNVLTNQTLFWVGPTFGFGFYRAGGYQVAFVFEATQKGINDKVALPQIRGQLVDSTTFFTNNYCWFLIATMENGKELNRCYQIDKSGTILATSDAVAGDSSWLGTIRGKCAIGNFLFAATDEGIVRVENDSGKLVETKKFPDTEPFVSSAVHLFPTNSGLAVVTGKEITILEIS